MKNFTLMAAALVLGLSLFVHDAEAARRLGGGGSSGMQRQSVAPSNTHQAAPAQPSHQAAAPAPAKQQPAPAPATPQRSSWMGPLAGLAAGLGLAALASHFGFGEALGNMMMIGLLVVGAMMLIGFLMRKKAGAAPLQRNDGLQYAGGAPQYREPEVNEYVPGSSGANQAAASTVDAPAPVAIPAGFDAEGFVRNAKVMFIRMQAANDTGNLDDIREFTSPEMFGEIKLALAERPAGAQETDVVQLEAQILDVTEEGARYVVSVRFNGLIREERNAPAEAFDEMWHLTKPRDGSRGWVLAGIQQIQ